MVGAGVAVTGLPAHAAESSIDLGTATPFSALGGSTVTNTGPSVLSGDLGLSPGTSVTGFPPGQVLGTVHATDAQASQAQTDLTSAYNDAAGLPSGSDLTGQDLGGLTLTPNVYSASSSMQLTGEVVLDGQGDPEAEFIFQVGSTLTTASGSTVTLINGADACNVFWQVGSSATLGTGSDFAGTIMALTSVTATTGVDVEGRLLARNGAVTLDTNVITTPDCADEPPVDEPPVDEPPVDEPPVDAERETGTVTDTGTGTGTGTGSGSGTSVPVVPDGNPSTGLGGASAGGDRSSSLHVGSAGLARAGALLLALRGSLVTSGR